MVRAALLPLLTFFIASPSWAAPPPAGPPPSDPDVASKAPPSKASSSKPPEAKQKPQQKPSDAASTSPAEQDAKAESVSEASVKSFDVEASEDAGGDDLLTKKDKALLSYGLGNVEASLANLRLLISTCDDMGEEACPDPVRAELYVALAIVLAGGKKDIPAASRLFHAALTRDPDVTVPREYATTPVQQAMREANESTSYQELESPGRPAHGEPTPKQAEPGASAEDSAADETAFEDPKDNKTGILLLHALAGAGSDDFGDTATAGAAAVIGARFVDSSAWTTAVRARAATVSGDGSAIAGLAVMMGGSWFNPKQKRLGYMLAGFGIDSYADEAALTAMGMGGVTLGGFLIGGGLEIGSGYASYGLGTLHLGWGGRL